VLTNLIDTAKLEWINDASHKPLVVKGVRQCGKTIAERICL